MADGIVGLAADGVGKKVDTTELTVGANIVERQRVQLAGSAAGDLVGTRPDGYLRVQQDPTTLIYDTFEMLDLTNTWIAGAVGSGTIPLAASGNLTITPGVAVGAASYLTSRPVFAPGSSAYLQSAMVIQLAAAVETNNKRIWGIGILAATPTAAVPISNGTIFECDSTGALFGAVYSNGVRTQSVALTRPTDGAVHRYLLYYKASRVYFELDNVAVGNLPFPNPAISLLSLLVGSFNDTTAPASQPTLIASLMGLADTGKNSSQISDGVFAFRKATVKPSGTPTTATDTALVVGIHPNSAGVTISNDQNIVTNSAGMLEVLNLMLIEMRVQSLILHSTLQCRDELDSLRNDASTL